MLLPPFFIIRFMSFASALFRDCKRATSRCKRARSCSALSFAGGGARVTSSAIAVVLPLMTYFTRSRVSEILVGGRENNIPVGPSFGTIVTERIIDMLIMLSLAMLAIGISPKETSLIFARLKESFTGPTDQSNNGDIWMYIFIAIVVVLLLLLCVKTIRQRILEFLMSLKDGLSSIFKVKQYWGYLLHTLFIWVSYLVMFALPFYAVDGASSVPFSGMLLAFCFGALGISFTNGGMGAYPLLIGVTTAYYLENQSVENADAIGYALGMIIWATQTIFLILLGLISLILMPRKYDSKVK